jgi:hypothetical protein
MPRPAVPIRHANAGPDDPEGEQSHTACSCNEPRLDRDVLGRPGVQWFILLEGINHINFRGRERRIAARNPPGCSRSQLVDDVRSLPAPKIEGSYEVLSFSCIYHPFRGDSRAGTRSNDQSFLLSCRSSESGCHSRSKRVAENYEGILDHLFSRATVFDNGTTSAAVITVDAGATQTRFGRLSASKSRKTWEYRLGTSC